MQTTFSFSSGNHGHSEHLHASSSATTATQERDHQPDRHQPVPPAQLRWFNGAHHRALAARVPAAYTELCPAGPCQPQLLQPA